MSKKRPTSKQLQAIAARYAERIDDFDLFRQQVNDFFLKSRPFQGKPLPLVHSVKSRVKDKDHLLEKICRKWHEKEITAENLFDEITDFAGVRVLHLHTQQFAEIHRAIMHHIDKGFWTLLEPPVAYSWDPEAIKFFEGLGLAAVTRATYYTSIHYVVKPHSNTDLTCEIQVRTLFEEIWGEIDHSLNYPKATTNIACREQLRVLAKLASTGTTLVDSIYKISDES